MGWLRRFLQGRSRLHCSRFSIAVEAVTASSLGQLLVSGRLQRGDRPQVGDKIRVVRTHQSGTVEDVSILGDDSAFRAAGIRVAFAVSEQTMRSSVGLRISGITVDEVRKGDEIVSC